VASLTEVHPVSVLTDRQWMDESTIRTAGWMTGNIMPLPPIASGGRGIMSTAPKLTR